MFWIDLLQFGYHCALLAEMHQMYEIYLRTLSTYGRSHSLLSYKIVHLQNLLKHKLQFSSFLENFHNVDLYLNIQLHDISIHLRNRNLQGKLHWDSYQVYIIVKELAPN